MISIGPDPVGLWLGMYFIGSGALLLGTLIGVLLWDWMHRDANPEQNPIDNGQ